MILELFSYFEELREEFKDNNTEVWTNATMIINISGEFKVEYNYEDILASDITTSQRQFIWEYKYLELILEDGDDRKFLEDYLNSIKE